MKKVAEETNFLGFEISRPLKGALIGFATFMIVTILCWIDRSDLIQVAWTLLSPVDRVLVVISMQTEFFNAIPQPISIVIYYGILFVLSAMPFTIFGALIYSKNKKIKNVGVMLLIIYTTVLIIVGPVKVSL